MKAVAPREEKAERGGRGEARRDATRDQWTETRVGDLCRLVNGSAFKPSDWSTEGVPIIRIQNLNDADKPYNYWAGDVDDCVRVRRGDILLAWSGTPGTSFGAHIWDGEDGVLNQHIFRVDLTSEEVTPAWFVWAVNFRLENLIGRAHGAVGLAHVTKGEVQALEIPLPPLAEQERIAGRLTEQLGAVERARAAAAQGLACGESLPGALLREVFDGPQASGWETRTLGELLNRYNEIIHPGDRKSGEAVFVGLEHIEPHTGRRIGAGKVEFASMTGRKPTFKRGHIVYGYLRPYLNKVWVADFDGCSSVDQFAFDVNPELADTTFVAAFMRSATFLRRAQGVTTTGQLPRISIDEIAAVKIDLPPDLPTQRRLAADLGQKLAAAEGVIARCREELAAIEALPASLLRDAFGGGREAESPEGA